MKGRQLLMAGLALPRLGLPPVEEQQAEVGKSRSLCSIFSPPLFRGSLCGLPIVLSLLDVSLSGALSLMPEDLNVFLQSLG